MNEFSEILKEYIAKKNKTVINMARFCQVDKSVMYKILKGTRNPTSADLVRKMAGCLQLTPDEEERFMEAYRITVDGKVAYYRRKKVEEFLRKPLLPAMDDIPYRISTELKTDQKISMFDNAYSVSGNIYDMVLNEAEKENGKLCLYITDADESFSQMIAAVLDQHPDLGLDYVMMINNDNYEYAGDRSGYLNLKKLSCILPMDVSQENRNIYYQYGTVSAALDQHLPYFTNLVLTSDTVIMISNGHTRSVCIRDPQVCSEYRKIFCEAMSVSRKLIVPAAHTAKSRTEIYIPDFNHRNVKLILGMCPAFSCSLTEEMINDLLLKKAAKREAVTGQIKEYLRKKKALFENSRAVFIHSMEGFRDIMRNGVLRDFPEGVFRPMDMMERISLLEEFISHPKPRNLYVLKEPVGSVENGMNILLYNNSLVFRFRDHNGSFRNVQVDEYSYFEAFEDYLESILAKKDLFYSEQELKDKLEELLNGYRISVAI